MKIKMKKTVRKVFAMTIISAMIMSQAGFAFADTEAENVPEVTEVTKTTEAPKAPEAPKAESHHDNDKITEYNNQVDEYNKAAESYNKAVDEEYDAAVRNAEETNKAVDEHNAAEEQKVKDAEERNAKALKDAEERNAQIDLENEEKAAQARKDAEEKYQRDLAQYNEDVKQYEKDYAQYQIDLSYEQKILAKGYSSVEQYNELINKNYNEPAKRAKEKNANAAKLNASDTYTLQEATEKSGKMITVTVEHYLDGTDVSIVDEFQIDANDIITFKALGAVAEPIQKGYAAFYYNTDDSHSMGYWASSYSYVATNAKYNNYGWLQGDSHEISLKDGTNHAYDDDGITVEYHYSWIPQYIYKTYNTPVEPTAPVEPEMGDGSYEATPHVTATVETVEADIWDHVMEPVKRGYVDMLTHIALFDVPEIANVIDAENADAAAGAAVQEAAAQNTAKAAQKTVKAAQNTAAAVQTAVISDEAAPLAASDVSSSANLIAENEVPMASPEGFWALINLIAAALTVILGALMAVGSRIRGKILGIAVAIASVIVFILTENMTLSMQLTDRWTALMVAILAIEALILAVSKRSDEEDEDNDNSKMAEVVNA